MAQQGRSRFLIDNDHGGVRQAPPKRSFTAGRRTVTVFDVDLPPGIAFVRSLGRAGVPVVACSSRPLAAGRLSRYVTSWRKSPPVHESDAFITWLVDEIRSGAIDLIAPTSDFVSFCVSEAMEKLGADAPDVGHPAPSAIRRCLFKGGFDTALREIGFPTLPTAVPSTLEDALEAASRIGYPVVLKPRSHVGVGTHRGILVPSEAELVRIYAPYQLGDAHESALRHVPELSYPLVQRYVEMGTADVVSVTGCLGRDGEVLALGHSRKVSQVPPRFGTGTMFEPRPSQPFTEQAVGAVRQLLGSGIFELEVLVDRATGEYWAIDLNPRAFGQMSLDIALGNDLPRLWYESVTGDTLGIPRRRRRMPAFWHDALSSYVGFAVRFVRGPRRRAILDHAVGRARAAKVGVVFEWSDPLPGIAFSLSHLRHPRAFLTQFLVDIELSSTPRDLVDAIGDTRPWPDHSR